MRGVRVGLSSGEAFYVTATLDETQAILGPAAYDGAMVQIGGRWVNGQQVAQLVAVDIPSVEIPESLEVPE